jgi:PIN domain nuclease of toxin-antitoxin system
MLITEQTPMLDNHSEDSTSPGYPLSDTQPLHPDAPSGNRSSLVSTLSDGQSSHLDSLNGERTPLQPPPPEDFTTVPDQEIKLQDLSRELEAAKIKLNWSERERQSTERKLATSTSECDELRNELKAYNQITDTLDTVAVLLDVELGGIVEAVTKLKVDHRRKTLLLRWVYTQKAIGWETRATPAEARLAVYADIGNPAQVRAAQEETRVTNTRNEILVSGITAKETALQHEVNKVQMLEGVVSTNEYRIVDLENELKVKCSSELGLRGKARVADQRIKDLVDQVSAKEATIHALQLAADKVFALEEAASIDKARIEVLTHEIHAKSLSELQLQEEARVADNHNKTLASSVSAKETAVETLQLEINKLQMLEAVASTNKDKIEDLECKLDSKSLSEVQLKEEITTLLGHLESARTKAESTEQALRDRLDVLLQKRLEPIKVEGMLQTLVEYQKTALDDVQGELAMANADRLGIQQELEVAKTTLEAVSTELGAFRYDIRQAAGPYYYGTATLPERILEFKTELTALSLSLKSVQGDSNLVKVEVLKTACEDLDTANKELEVVRTERDGIYKTLNVSGCLGAHLTIGDLKLAQLECEVLRKAIGDFEDQEAVREIKRLKKANVELVKVEYALDGCAGDSNVAKIDALKAACEKK